MGGDSGGAKEKGSSSSSSSIGGGGGGGGLPLGPGLHLDTLNTLNSTLASSADTVGPTSLLAGGWRGARLAQRGSPPLLAMSESIDASSSAAGTAMAAAADSSDLQHTERLLMCAQQEVRSLKDEKFEHEDEIAQAKKTVMALAQRSETAVAENEHMSRKVEIGQRELQMVKEQHERELQQLATESARTSAAAAATAAAEHEALTNVIVELRDEAKRAGNTQQSLEAEIKMRDNEGQAAVVELASKCDALTQQWETLLQQRDAAAEAASKENAALRQQLSDHKADADARGTAAEAAVAELESQLKESVSARSGAVSDLEATIAMLKSSLQQSEARADGLETRHVADVKEADAKTAAVVTQIDQIRSERDMLKRRVAEERQQRDAVASEAAIHLAELTGKREQVQKQMRQITELQRSADHAAAELRQREGHTDVIKSQMVEITRLRTETRQMASSVANVESSKLAAEAAARQQQDVLVAKHRGELAEMQRDLDAAVVKIKDAEASKLLAAESRPAALAQARREGEAAAAMAAADKAREVASQHSIEMLKLSTKPAELQVQLEQAKSSVDRLNAQHEADMMQLNEVVERVSAENANLHDGILQASEQKMSLMVEHEERIKLGQQQVELTEVCMLPA